MILISVDVSLFRVWTKYASILLLVSLNSERYNCIHSKRTWELCPNFHYYFLSAYPVIPQKIKSGLHPLYECPLIEQANAIGLDLISG